MALLTLFYGTFESHLPQGTFACDVPIPNPQLQHLQQSFKNFEFILNDQYYIYIIF